MGAHEFAIEVLDDLREGYAKYGKEYREAKPGSAEHIYAGIKLYLIQSKILQLMKSLGMLENETA